MPGRGALEILLTRKMTVLSHSDWRRAVPNIHLRTALVSRIRLEGTPIMPFNLRQLDGVTFSAGALTQETGSLQR